jgi:hypothetical protein
MSEKRNQFAKGHPVRPGTAKAAAEAALVRLRALPLPPVTLDIKVSPRPDADDVVELRVWVPTDFTAEHPFFADLRRAMDEALMPFARTATEG